MRFLSTAALAALAIATPAAAQGGSQAAPAPAERKYDLSKEARNAIADAQKAVRERAADARAKIDAAKALAKTTDDNYFIAKLLVEHGVNLADKAIQREGAEAVLASGGADPAETRQMQGFVAGQKLIAKDFAGAETLYAEMLKGTPNDVDLTVQLARTKLEQKKDLEAADLLKRVIELSRAAGQKPAEAWYRTALSIYARAQNPAAAELARGALADYPTKDNFTNVVATSQGAVQGDDAVADLMRLRLDAGLIADPAGYTFLARYLNAARNWGEAQSVLEAAKKAGKTDAAQASILASITPKIPEDKAALPTLESRARSDAGGQLSLTLAEAYAGYGQTPKAIEFFRLALQKGGVDAPLVNTRLGIVLARSGDAAGAKAAFEAVTGPRATLAKLWLGWLALPKA
jgi:hypothetical protein